MGKLYGGKGRVLTHTIVNNLETLMMNSIKSLHRNFTLVNEMESNLDLLQLEICNSATVVFSNKLSLKIIHTMYS